MMQAVRRTRQQGAQGPLPQDQVDNSEQPPAAGLATDVHAPTGSIRQPAVAKWQRSNSS